MSKSSESPLLGLGRIIAFHRGFVDLTGTVHGALLLSQAMYWQSHTKADDGWWHKTKEEWEFELGLSRRYLDSAAKDCQKWLKTELRGMPARTFWQLDVHLLESDLIELSTGSRQTRLAANAKQDWHQTPNKNGTESQTSLAANAKQYIRSDENTDYNTRLPHQITTTTTTAQPVQVGELLTGSDQNLCGGGGDFEKQLQKPLPQLHLPDVFKTPEERKAITQLVEQCGNDAQSVLDVAQAAILAGQVRKSPTSLIIALVRRHATGTFDPSPGKEVADRRNGVATTKTQYAHGGHVPFDLSRYKRPRMQQKTGQES